MQNHYEITSKSQFWTRNVENSTKSRKSDMSGRTAAVGRAVAGGRRRSPAVGAGFSKIVGFGLQTAFFDGFNVFFTFLAEICLRTVVESSQKASFGSETCEIRPKVWFLASGFCLLRLGEPSGGNWGNLGGRSTVTAL